MAQEPRQVLQHAPRIGIGREAHHEVRERIDDIDVIRRRRGCGQRFHDVSRARAQDVQSGMRVYESPVGYTAVGHYPNALDAFALLRLRKPQLPHVDELGAATFVTRRAVGHQQYPLAFHVGETERAAVETFEARIGQRSRLEQRAVIDLAARPPHVVRHVRSQDRRNANRDQQPQRQAATICAAVGV